MSRLSYAKILNFVTRKQLRALRRAPVLAILATHHRVCLVVAHDLLFIGIKDERAPQSRRQITQVTKSPSTSDLSAHRH